MTEEDIDNIRAFKLRMISNMPRQAFNQIRYAFQHKLSISSLYIITRRMAILSCVVPEWIHCCIRSCIAYTGPEYENLEECPVCQEKRYTRRGKPRRLFCYIPLIPRLKRFFTNPESIEELSYRHNYDQKEGVISDVFDSEHYKSLCRKTVTVDGVRLPHKYFSHKHDIAFSICLDGYLLYKRRRNGPSAIPLLLQLYNLPPDIRTHLSRLVCLGVIPGPRAPKRLHTFLLRFEDECAELARGVRTFDCVDKTEFDLHAYNIFKLGDIVAIEKMLNIKGHNGKAPCRSCKIKAINDPTSTQKTYYVPLQRPGTSAKRTYTVDPYELPLRSHNDWRRVTEMIQGKTTKVARNAIAMEHGIKGMPILGRVGSLDYARGIPWDIMHLFFENVVKNLVNLWMGKFKGLESGREEYIIPEKIWEEIGIETTNSIRTIPSAFVRSLGNIAEDQSYYTAEGWSFWFLYLAPILLKDRFQKRRYYLHMCDLVRIIKTTLKFTLTTAEIDGLEVDIIAWVKKYEKYVHPCVPIEV